MQQEGDDGQPQATPPPTPAFLVRTPEAPRQVCAIGRQHAGRQTKSSFGCSEDGRRQMGSTRHSADTMGSAPEMQQLSSPFSADITAATSGTPQGYNTTISKANGRVAGRRAGGGAAGGAGDAGGRQLPAPARRRSGGWHGGAAGPGPEPSAVHGLLRDLLAAAAAAAGAHRAAVRSPPPPPTPPPSRVQFACVGAPNKDSAGTVIDIPEPAVGAPQDQV